MSGLRVSANGRCELHCHSSGDGEGSRCPDSNPRMEGHFLSKNQSGRGEEKAKPRGCRRQHTPNTSTAASHNSRLPYCLWCEVGRRDSGGGASCSIVVYRRAQQTLMTTRTQQSMKPNARTTAVSTAVAQNIIGPNRSQLFLHHHVQLVSLGTPGKPQILSTHNLRLIVHCGDRVQW